MKKIVPQEKDLKRLVDLVITLITEIILKKNTKKLH